MGNDYPKSSMLSEALTTLPVSHMLLDQITPTCAEGGSLNQKLMP